MDAPPSPEPHPGGGVPPPLPATPPPLPGSRPPSRRKRLSVGRQIARVLVWVTFFVVLGARLAWQPGRQDLPRFGRPRCDEAAGRYCMENTLSTLAAPKVFAEPRLSKRLLRQADQRRGTECYDSTHYGQ